MDWLLPFRAPRDGRRGESALPPALMRHVFHERHVGPGSRVLDVGCGTGTLVRWLDGLGIDAVGLDWRPDAIVRARADAAWLPFRVAQPHDDLPLNEGQFDLVLARDVPAYQGDLFSPQALMITANLLSAVRPGGDLVILMSSPSQPDDSALHHRSCLARHLATFPGVSRVRFVKHSRPLLGRLFRPYASQGTQTASLRIPATPMPLAQWRRLALRVLAMPSTSACCAREATRPQVRVA